MPFLAILRRYSLLVLLFGLGLSVVLFSTPPGNYTHLIAGRVSSSAAPYPQKNLSAQKLRITSQKSSNGDLSSASGRSLTQNVVKTILDNGMTVLTKEVHTAPVVSVQVWYKVGSRNEAAGVNGIAHQLEHMLFKGTTSRPIQFGRLFSALGSDANAFTSYDQTAYFATVEREKLLSLLVLEADRMQNSRIDAASLASEKRVVISELQGYENSPDYRLNRAVMRAAFPDRAYGLPVGGTKADVKKFTVEQVRDYYRKYYSPDNATLVIVGDFQPEPTLKAVKEIFGNIKGLGASADRDKETGEKPQSQIQNPKIEKSPIANIVLREPGSAALLEVVYPLPPIAHSDVPALDVMDFILTEGRNSRLYQVLVESGIASEVSADASSLLDGGWYDVSATAAPGQELTKLEQVFEEAIAKLRDRGITQEELHRAKAKLSASAILQNRDIVSQGMQLGYDHTTAGDYRYSDRYLAGVEKVTAADVQRVARTYLNKANRTIGFFEPTQESGQTSPAGKASAQTTEQFNLGPPVDPAEVRAYLPQVDGEAKNLDADRPIAPPPPLPEKVRLSNGLVVLLMPDKSTPTVTLSGFVRAGTEFDRPEIAGVANLTAANLMNGTPTKDAHTLSKVLEDIGASLAFEVSREGVMIDGNSLSADLPALIETLADVLQNASFPLDQLELIRQQNLTALREELDTPQNVAEQTFQQAVYPNDHPFHVFPTPESLKRVTRKDVVAFKQKHYRPDTTVLTLVGDFEPSQARSLIETSFRKWKAKGKQPMLDFPPVPSPPKLVQLNPILPGKAQSITYLGYNGIDRQDRRYYAATVLNQILGGDTLSSRLGNEIRDRQGLTYGIYSYFQAGINAGLFLIQMQTAPEDSQRAIASTVELLRQLHVKGVREDEVAAAKQAIASRYPVSLINPDDLAQTILMNEVYGLDLAELRQFTDKIQAVTLADVREAASNLLYPDNLVVVTAGPPVSASR